MQRAKTTTPIVDLQLLEEPIRVKNIPRKVPVNQFLGWRPSGSGDAHRFSGRRSSVSWEGREGEEEWEGKGEGRGWVPFFMAGSVRLYRGPLFPRFTQPRLGLMLKRAGLAPTRHPSYSPLCPASSWAWGRLASNVEQMLVEQLRTCRGRLSTPLARQARAGKWYSQPENTTRVEPLTTPCYILELRSMFLPCVFAGSGVSTTPQRLWPAAPWTGNCAGTKERESIWCSVQPGHHRHGHLPSTPPGGTRGLFILLGVREHVLQVSKQPGNTATSGSTNGSVKR